FFRLKSRSSDFVKPWELFVWQTKEEEERLKYLQFVQAAGVHALVTFTNLYIYAKDKAGPLKPRVETMEGTVKNVVGPVYDKYQDVPIGVLKFVDRKVSELVLVSAVLFMIGAIFLNWIEKFVLCVSI
ncbi:REF/SRPP-like protein At3g05500, partial [Linum perenne]